MTVRRGRWPGTAARHFVLETLAGPFDFRDDIAIFYDSPLGRLAYYLPSMRSRSAVIRSPHHRPCMRMKPRYRDRGEQGAVRRRRPTRYAPG